TIAPKGFRNIVREQYQITVKNLYFFKKQLVNTRVQVVKLR
ncbi:hypothetical protein HMPREF2738_03224, partial [Clostridiales bacterium KLE1615]